MHSRLCCSSDRATSETLLEDSLRLLSFRRQTRVFLRVYKRLSLVGGFVEGDGRDQGRWLLGRIQVGALTRTQRGRHWPRRGNSNSWSVFRSV